MGSIKSSHKFFYCIIVFTQLAFASINGLAGNCDFFNEETPPPEILKAFETIEIERKKESSEILKSCEKASNPSACAMPKLEALNDPVHPKNRAFLDKLFGKSCLAKPGAKSPLAAKSRRNYYINAGISLSSLVGGYYATHATNPEYKFPVAVLVQNQLFTLIGAELTCRNLQRDSGSDEKKSKNPKWDNFKSYALFNVAAISTLMGMIAAEDYLKGEDITSEEKLKQYLGQGLFALGNDLLFSGLHVAYLDKFFVQSVPNFREFLVKSMQSGAVKFKWLENQKTLVMVSTEAAGQSAEVMVRFLYSYLRSVSWQAAMTEIKEKSK